MNLPGFTAEASLCPAHALDSVAETLNNRTLPGLTGGQNINSVQPARSIYVDGRYFCDGYIDGFGNVRCWPLRWRGSFF